MCVCCCGDESTSESQDFDDHDDMIAAADHKTLKRILSPLEEEYLECCRNTISRLTGEKFVSDIAPWMVCTSSSGIVQMYTDGYCEKFKIVLEYLGTDWDFGEDMIWDLAISAGVSFQTAATEMGKYINNERMTATMIAEYWIIFIPKPENLPAAISSMYAGESVEMTLREAVEEYFRRRLHQLTVFLPFVGSPRCTCVSKRDPNPEQKTIRELKKIEARPGQSILELLRK